MNRKYLASILAVLLLTFFSITVRAAINDEREDTDIQIIDAQVVEVTDCHISIIARSGVEHVIAIDNLKTKVMIEEQEVSLKDVREGDIITIELDEQNPMKFARVISMTAEQVQVARVRR